MKINSIYVSSFGKLKDLRINLKDGLNVIYGDNEQGKTTLMAFIKMMFYGSSRAAGQLSKNPRQKYTPWDSSNMAGSIEFEHKGRRYRIEREFRSSNSTDKVTLYDLDLGESHAVASNVGEGFFGISVDAFERSVFIGQFGFLEKDAASEGEINSKLSNLTLTGEENVSYEEVHSRLQKAKTTLMSKSGKTGIYDKNLKLLEETSLKIEKCKNVQKTLSEKRSSVSQLEKEIESISAKATELKTHIESEQDIRNAQKLKDLLEYKKQLDEINQNLALSDGGIIDEMYLGKLRFCISKVTVCKNKLEAKNNEKQFLQENINKAINPSFDATDENAKRINQQIRDNQNRKATLEKELENLLLRVDTTEQEPIVSKHKKGFLVLMVVSVLFAVFGEIAFILLKSLFLGLVGFGIFIALFCLGLILSLFGRKDNKALQKKQELLNQQISDLKMNINSLTGEISILSTKLEAIETILNNNSAIIENQQKMLLECENEIEKIHIELESENNSLYNLFEKYKSVENFEQIISEIEILSQKTRIQKELKQKLKFILNDLNGISYETAEKKLEQIKESNISFSNNFAELKKQYENLNETILEKRTVIATLNAEIKSILATAENPEKLKESFKNLQDTVSQQKEFCLIIDLAASVLAESFAEVRRSYGSVLDKKATEIFSSLTDGKYNTVNISKAFDISVQQQGVFGGKDIAYLSSGAVDQAYLSLRLAITELMAETDNPLPIFLDDALAQYDDNRMKQALQFLKEYSQKNQMIMFTCHSIVADFSKKIGGNTFVLGE